MSEIVSVMRHIISVHWQET